MKIAVLSLVSVFLATTAAHAMDVSAYEKALGYQNSCASSANDSDSRINDTEAQMIATEVSGGRIELDVFLSLYYNNCSFDSANQDAQEVLSGTMDYQAYAKAFEAQDSCGNLISERDAEIVGEEASAKAKQIDVDQLLSIEHNNCNFDFANLDAKQIKGGIMDYQAYAAAFGFQDSCKDAPIGESDAEMLGRLASDGGLKIGDFLQVYKQNCNIDSALKVVQR